MSNYFNNDQFMNELEENFVKDEVNKVLRNIKLITGNLDNFKLVYDYEDETITIPVQFDYNKEKDEDTWDIKMDILKKVLRDVYNFDIDYISSNKFNFETKKVNAEVVINFSL